MIKSMYITRVFDTYYDVTQFLNNHHISKENIICINTFSRGVALIYLGIED